MRDEGIERIMIITQQILDELSAKARVSERVELMTLSDKYRHVNQWK